MIAAARGSKADSSKGGINCAFLAGCGEPPRATGKVGRQPVCNTASPSQPGRLVRSGRQGMASEPLKSDSLEAVSAQNYAGTSNAGAERQRLIQSILKHAQDKQWRKVLEVNGISDERQVQRQFRKLAKLVHPDKCNVEGAEAAFKAICLAAAEHSSALKGANVAEEGDVYWWEAWEDDAVEKRRKRAESPNLDAEDVVWQAGLHLMSVEELKREVTQLQASVFSKSTTTSDIQMPVHRKQQRLRQARSLLSNRLEESAKEMCCDGPRMAGGFL
ncbi:hypothetical protein COCOBI_02-7030 [Coccomyxa sp. Obi]|nr:hypothetical protein COCOBI_02-7030 [Coccomyxa sp. Obi]